MLSGNIAVGALHRYPLSAALCARVRSGTRRSGQKPTWRAALCANAAARCLPRGASRQLVVFRDCCGLCSAWHVQIVAFASQSPRFAAFMVSRSHSAAASFEAFCAGEGVSPRWRTFSMSANGGGLAALANVRRRCCCTIMLLGGGRCTSRTAMRC